MLIGDDDNFIEVNLAELTPPTLMGAGDLCLRVRVAFSTFRGENDEVWVGADAFRVFLSEPQAPETRQGLATLLSISPGELLLEFHSIDRAGHLGLTGQLGRWCHAGGGGMSWCQLPFHFVLPCPSLMPVLLAEFRAMATDA